MKLMAQLAQFLAQMLIGAHDAVDLRQPRITYDQNPSFFAVQNVAPSCFRALFMI